MRAWPSPCPLPAAGGLKGKGSEALTAERAEIAEQPRTTPPRSRRTAQRARRDSLRVLGGRWGGVLRRPEVLGGLSAHGGAGVLWRNSLSLGRMVGGIVTAVLLFSFLPWAQTPIDPLRRPDEAAGEYTWQLGLGYTPSGREGFGVDAFGQPYGFTLLSHEWRLSLTGTVHFGEGWRTGVAVSQSTTTLDEVRRYPWGEERLSSSERGVAYSVFQEWRIDPKNPWDPRVSMSLGHPWKGGIGVAASFLRDPMVLVGEVGLRSQEEEPHAWFTLGLGAGFVANAWISVSTSGSLDVPVLGVGVPVTSLGVRLRYALDPRGKGELGVRATLSLRGDRAWVSLEAEWTGRGP